ncbi:hypothetical protein LQZ19_19085 [Treponema primitia]|uniref:hypothetical protein n=1 Tax=Treponema primitia TaxID=88058 RepID=UPI00398162A7
MKKTILGLAVLLFMASCDFFLGPSAGEGNVTIQTGNGTGRAALPPESTEKFRYEFTFTRLAQSFTMNLDPGVQSLNLSLNLGEWFIAATAYADGDVLAGEGEMHYTVVPGNNLVLVPMKVIESYLGQETITISFTDSSDESVTLTITGLADDGSGGKTLSWFTSNFILTAAGGASYQWYKDGVDTLNSTDTFSAPGSDFTLGKHQIMVKVITSTGAVYSRTVEFTVE